MNADQHSNPETGTAPNSKRRRRMKFAAIALLALACLLIWRLNEPGQSTLPSGPNAPVVSIGYGHGLVVAPDGSLWSWGGEVLGWPVLGRASTNAPPEFSRHLKRIGTDKDWLSVSAGQDHNLAMKADGTVWAWGADHRGQLGDGQASRKSVQVTPVQTAEGNDWVQVVAGSVCSFALRKDGSLWAWGVNNFYRLGTDAVTETANPLQIGTATNWIKVAAGGVSGAGIKSDGSLWIWGGSPKFGNSSTQASQNIAMPTQFGTDSTWIDVSVDHNIWLAVRSDGTLWAWGRNAHIFTGAEESAAETPVQIGMDTDWQACWSANAGFMHLLRKRDGSFWMLEAPHQTRDSLRIRQIHVPDNMVAVDFGGYRRGTGAVITRDGEVWTWGTVLGERAAKERLAELFNRISYWLGRKARWEPRPNPTEQEEPWRLRVIGGGDSEQAE